MATRYPNREPNRGFVTFRLLSWHSSNWKN